MTLADFATNICAKLLKSDATSIAIAKTFVAQRYKLIWESFLWKDSVVTFHDLPVPKDPRTSDYRSEIVFPDAVARVVLVWNENGRQLLSPGDMLDLARMGNSETTQDGSLLGFVELPATGIPIPSDSSAYSVRFTAESEDIGKVVGVHFGGERDDNAWTGTSPSWNTEQSVAITLDAGPAWHVLAGKVAGMTKPVTVRRVTVNIKTDYEAAFWYWPAESTLAEFARVRLIDRPTVKQYGTALKVGCLGKRKPRSLVRDTDAPTLRGCESALLALGLGDMLERERMYTKANAKFSEGAALLEAIKDQERNQSAFVQRLVPEVSGYSGDRDTFGW